MWDYSNNQNVKNRSMVTSIVLSLFIMSKINFSAEIPAESKIILIKTFPSLVRLEVNQKGNQVKIKALYFAYDRFETWQHEKFAMTENSIPFEEYKVLWQNIMKFKPGHLQSSYGVKGSLPEYYSLEFEMSKEPYTVTVSSGLGLADLLIEYIVNGIKKTVHIEMNNFPDSHANPWYEVDWQSFLGTNDDQLARIALFGLVEWMYVYVDSETDFRRLAEIKDGNEIAERIKSKRKTAVVNYGLDNISKKEINSALSQSITYLKSEQVEKERQEILKDYPHKKSGPKALMNLLENLHNKGFVKGKKIHELMRKEQFD